MSQLKGACVIAQSGGPTAVINASAQGVIQTALKKTGCITRVLGAAHGIKGCWAISFTIWAKRMRHSWSCFSTPPPRRWAPAGTSWPTRTGTTAITGAFLKFSRSMTCATFSITAAMNPWIPAARSADICRRRATSAASWAFPRPSTTTCSAPTTVPAIPAPQSISPPPAWRCGRMRGCTIPAPSW